MSDQVNTMGVTLFSPGEPLNADTLNRPIKELSTKIAALTEKLKAISSANGSVIRTGVKFTSNSNLIPHKYDIVCINPTTGLCEKAYAGVSSFDKFTASPSSYSIGICVESSDTGTGSVQLFGYIKFNDISSIELLLESNEKFRSGPYFLSSIEPGKLTANPCGPIVSVGIFVDDSCNEAFGFINPKLDFLSMPHVHRTYSLSARPVGDISDTDYIDDSHVRLSGFIPDNGDESVRLAIGGSWLLGGNRDDKLFTLHIKLLNGTITCDTKQDSTVIDHCSIPIDSFNNIVDLGKTGLCAWLVGDSQFPTTELEWTLNAPFDICGWVSTFRPHKMVSDTDSVSGTYIGTFPKPNSHITVHILDNANVYTVPVRSDMELNINGTVFSTGNIATGIHITLSNASKINSVMLFADAINSELNDVFAVCGTNQNISEFPSLIILTKYHIDGSLDSGKNCLVSGYDDLFPMYIMSGYVAQGESKEFTLGDTDNKILIERSAESIDKVAVVDLIAFGVDPRAKFEYLVGTDSELASVYPPIPFESAELLLNGVELDQGGIFSGMDYSYSIGPKSIYWISNNMNRLPWALEWNRHDDTLKACDINKITFSMVRTFIGNTGPVTSLRAPRESAISVRDCASGTTSKIGDLLIDVDLANVIEDGSEPGFNVIKQVRENKFITGPVVEKLIPGPGIELSRSQGVVTISGVNSSGGQFNDVMLHNAKQDAIGMFPFIRFPSKPSGVPRCGCSAMFRVPISDSNDALVLESGYRLIVYITAFSLSSSTNNTVDCAFKFNYNILRNSVFDSSFNYNIQTGNLDAPENPIDSYFRFINVDTSDVEYTAYNPIVFHTDFSKREESVPGKFQFIFSDTMVSDPMPIVFPGDFVGISFFRDDNLNSDVGFIDLQWKLVKNI